MNSVILIFIRIYDVVAYKTVKEKNWKQTNKTPKKYINHKNVPENQWDEAKPWILGSQAVFLSWLL